MKKESRDAKNPFFETKHHFSICPGSRHSFWRATEIQLGNEWRYRYWVRNTDFLQPDKLPWEPIYQQLGDKIHWSSTSQHMLGCGCPRMPEGFRGTWLGEGLAQEITLLHPGVITEQKHLHMDSRRVAVAEAAASATQQRAVEWWWSMLLSLEQSPGAHQAQIHPSVPGQCRDRASLNLHLLGEAIPFCPSKIQAALAYYNNDFAHDLGTVFSVYTCSASLS